MPAVTESSSHRLLPTETSITRNLMVTNLRKLGKQRINLSKITNGSCTFEMNTFPNQRLPYVSRETMVKEKWELVFFTGFAGDTKFVVRK